jgi:hypothetical protein
MRGSNPRLLAHKTNTLPTELMEPVCLIFSPTKAYHDRMRVRGLVVMIVACQVMDPGSIPGERIFFLTSLSLSLSLSLSHLKKKKMVSGQPESNQ